MILFRPPFDRPPTVEELLVMAQTEELNFKHMAEQMAEKVGSKRRTEFDLRRAEERHFFHWWVAHYLSQAVERKHAREDAPMKPEIA